MANMRQIMQGLEIAAKYVDPDNVWLSADHDVIFLPLSTSTQLSPDDEAALQAHGAHEDSSADCWVFFT